VAARPVNADAQLRYDHRAPVIVAAVLLTNRMCTACITGRLPKDRRGIAAFRADPADAGQGRRLRATDRQIFEQFFGSSEHFRSHVRFHIHAIASAGDHSGLAVICRSSAAPRLSRACRDDPARRISVVT